LRQDVLLRYICYCTNSNEALIQEYNFAKKIKVFLKKKKTVEGVKASS